MSKDEILKEVEAIFESLDKAYDAIGGARDTFSSWPENNHEIQGSLKEHCNNIRGQIYLSRNEASILIRKISKQQ